MINQTKFSKSTQNAQLRSMKPYSGTIFAPLTMFTNLLSISINLMTKISAQTSQPGLFGLMIYWYLMRRTLMNIWTLMAASLLVKHQSMDVKLVPMKSIHFNASEMGKNIVFTNPLSVMVIHIVTALKMKTSHYARMNT